MAKKKWVSMHRTRRMIVSAAAVVCAVPGVHAGTSHVAALKDNTLYQDLSGSTSNGSGQFLFVGETAGSSARRAVMAFDFANYLPTNVVGVNSVTLTVFGDKGHSSGALNIYRLTKNWGEGASNAGDPGGSGTLAAPGDATWKYNFYNTSQWTNLGGDFAATASATGSIGAGSWSYSSAQMAADVQGWITSPATNFGWILVGDEAGFQTATRLFSRENTFVELRPDLAVDYNASTWKTGSGLWSAGTSWNFGIPSGAGAEANFTFTSGPTIAVNVDSARTVGTLNFGGSNYTLSGSAITLNRTTGPVQINVASGSHTIASALNVSQNLNVDVAGGSSLAVTGALTPAAGISIAKTNDGMFRVPSVRAQSLNVLGGILAVSTNGGNPGISYVNNLSIAPIAALDLNDNDLVVNNGVFADVQALVFGGFRQAPDPTATGIISTTAQNDNGKEILALFDNSLIGVADWPPGSGITVSHNAIIGKYTYFGDMNFDGQVTGDDYPAIDSNLGTTPPPGVAWFNGDANLDGIVTGDDYAVIDSNLGNGTNNPLALGGIAPVPEPGSIALVGAALLLRRKRQPRAL